MRNGINGYTSEYFNDQRSKKKKKIDSMVSSEIFNTVGPILSRLNIGINNCFYIG